MNAQMHHLTRVSTAILYLGLAAAVVLGLLARSPGTQALAAPPTEAQLASEIDLTPNALAVDSSGNVYIGDHANNVVRKVSPDGSLSVIVVGDGTEGAPSAGPASSTRLINPTGLAVGPAGVLYVADGGSGAILKVDQGVASVFAGQPQPLDGPPALPPIDGTATDSSLFGASGLALDGSGNLFTALSWYSVALKVSPASRLSIVAGVPATVGRPSPDGPATRSYLYFPTDVAVDGEGNLYIADSENYVVSKVDTAGTLSIVAGSGYQGTPWTGGPARSSDLGSITGVAVDAAGNLYIADPDNHLVLKVDGNGDLSIVAGTGAAGTPAPGPAVESALDGPSSVAVDDEGNVFIADVFNHVVLKVDAAGILSVFAGTGQKSAPGSPTITNLPGAAATGGGFVAQVGTNSDGEQTVMSSTPGVCTTGQASEDGTPVSFVGDGLCTLTASVDEGTSWLAAEGQPQSFTISDQAIGQAGLRQVIAALGAALTGDAKADKPIRDAIKAIQKSLDPANWANELTPSDSKGNRVFDEVRKAVVDLMKPGAPSPVMLGAIDELVRISRALADAAVIEAAATGGDAKRITKARSWMLAATEELTRARPDKAIENYKKAWTEAIKA